MPARVESQFTLKLKMPAGHEEIVLLRHPGNRVRFLEAMEAARKDHLGKAFHPFTKEHETAFQALELPPEAAEVLRDAEIFTWSSLSGRQTIGPNSLSFRKNWNANKLHGATGSGWTSESWFGENDWMAVILKDADQPSRH